MQSVTPHSPASSPRQRCRQAHRSRTSRPRPFARLLRPDPKEGARTTLTRKPLPSRTLQGDQTSYKATKISCKAVQTLLSRPSKYQTDSQLAGTCSQAFTPNSQPYTLHPTPYTLHPTPYTLHPAPARHQRVPSSPSLLLSSLGTADHISFFLFILYYYSYLSYITILTYPLLLSLPILHYHSYHISVNQCVPYV